MVLLELLLEKLVHLAMLVDRPEVGNRDRSGQVGDLARSIAGQRAKS